MKKLMRLDTMLVVAIAALFVGCTPDSGFSLSSEESVFEQSVTRTKVKVDILWVVDNSGSMETSQDAVASNFQAFINKFQETNFDYQIAVTTTEAWRASHPNGDPSLSRFRDGTDATAHSGITVIKPDSPNLEETFITNIVQGVKGSGDERGWQSLKEALTLQANLDEPFPRQDALLAVIFLGDEDDFSHDGMEHAAANYDGNAYANPGLHDPMMYYDFLFDLTNSTEGNLNFQVSMIGILDQQCLDDLNSTFTGRTIGSRFLPVVEATGGYQGSLCADFTDVMSGISDTILEKGTSFKLDREPVVESIVVKVNGAVVPMDNVNGWSYDQANRLIIFHGDAVPGSEAQVAITFDPAGLK